MATEKRLVYANEVEEIFNYVENECSDSYNAFKSAIKNATTVDAVEVVRCKDCKHYVLRACACRHENFNGIIHMNGFCSYGERRT